MRATVLFVSLALLAAVGAAARPSTYARGALSQVEGQDWDEYTNVTDGFKINFPGQPKVTVMSPK